jgi:hypothetical protein
MSMPAAMPSSRSSGVPVAGQLRRRVLQDPQHVFLGFADGQSADRKAVEADVGETAQRFIAQRLIHAALDDAEQRIALPACFAEARVLVAAALRPAQREAHRRRGLVLGRGAPVDFVRRALVEDHRDVRVQHALDPHRLLGRQEEAVAVDGGGEAHAIFGDLA